ncbi:hypothetical protein [Nocardia sp. NPDC050710]|uniref:hypothetical protein n=1 Tax=Nocardia sp. NPDC050710 TaxID=3157220 RepID=UPI0033CF3994
MEPVMMVATAVAVGAAAGMTETTKQAVGEAYSALKRLIARRYGSVDVGGVEHKPNSEARRSVLAEDLAEAGAGADTELLVAAQTLIALVCVHEVRAGAAVGVDLERIDVGGSLRVEGIDAAGTGLRGSDLGIAGDVAIAQVRAGIPPPKDPPSA